MLPKLKYILLLSVLSVSLSVLQSCHKELQSEDPVDNISFTVQSDAGAETKTSNDADSFTLNLGTETLELCMLTEENDDVLCIDDLQTRGSSFDNDSNPISSIKVTAIVENGTGGDLYFTDDVSISGGKGSSHCYWPDKKLSFFAHSVSKDNVTINPSFQRQQSVCKGSFSYTLPAAATSSSKKDATNQPDVVFAITPDQSKSSGGAVNLRFHHALSALIFKVGQMPGDTYLNSIAIDGVYSSGVCNVTAADDNDVYFEWIFDGKTQNAKYTEDIMKAPIWGEQMGGQEAVFMMLPQTMGDATKLIISFTIEGQEFTIEKNFKEIVSSWEADKRYIFTIGIPSGVKVEVEDQVSADKTIKSNLAITNTGYEEIYVRAIIYGEWVSVSGDDEVLVGTWDMESDGVFNNFNTTDWLYCPADGYYYYKNPLAVGEEAIDLFESYELNTVPPVVEAELQLSIITQAVALRHLGNAWGGFVTTDSNGNLKVN